MVADKNAQFALKGALARPKALGIRRIEFEFRVHPGRDGGARKSGPEVLALERRRFKHGLLVLDFLLRTMPGADMVRVVNWSFYGPDALLLSFENGLSQRRQIAGVFESLRRCPPPCLREVVPGFSSLLLLFERRYRDRLSSQADQIIARLRTCEKPKPQEGPLLEVPVVYDGPDLDEVARIIGKSPQEVIRLHTRPIYTVMLLGFAPGFPYLAPLHPRLRIPRRQTPRLKVEKGAVGIGGPHTGIYPIASSGGWHLLGRTDIELFNPKKTDRPFFFSPGDRVRFVAVGGGRA